MTMTRFLDMDRSSLEEFANDLVEIQDYMTGIIKFAKIPIETKALLSHMRYKLASYLDPICCVCGESSARYVNDGWYCERCVKKGVDLD